MVVKSRDFSLDGEPVKIVGLQSAHENRELRIAYQGTLYGENNHTDTHYHTACTAKRQADWAQGLRKGSTGR
jgi:hypothetical protein